LGLTFPRMPSGMLKHEAFEHGLCD
jgi:hypothetical protein